MRRFHFLQIAIFFSLVGLLSTLLLIISNQKINLRSMAQSANVQVKCSPSGKVQFAISFTNPEAVPINLLADVLIDTQTVSRNYLNVTPGQTRTDLISTNFTSLPNVGDVVFTWFPVTDPANTKDIAASFNAITCKPVALSPSPTTTINSDGETDSSILALTPLPAQPEKKPEPFYQPIITELTTRVQTLISNFFRFFSAFQ